MRVYSVKHLILNFGLLQSDIKNLWHNTESKLCVDKNRDGSVKNLYLKATPLLDNYVEKHNTWNYLSAHPPVKHQYKKFEEA